MRFDKLESMLLILWIEVLNVSERVAPFINIAILTPFNFLLHKCFTFRRIGKLGSGEVE